jgi:hypothetical protein
MKMLTDVFQFALDVGAIKLGEPLPSKSTALYEDLVREEYREFIDAKTDEEKLDGAMDLIWVLLGYCICRGWNIMGAWDAVARTNRAKLQIDPVTKELKRRADGKILKPDGWKAPDLTPFLNK